MRRPDLMGIRHRVASSTLGHWSVEPGPSGWEIHVDERRLVTVEQTRPDQSTYADALLMAKARQDLSDLLDYVRELEGRGNGPRLKKVPGTMFG